MSIRQNEWTKHLWIHKQIKNWKRMNTKIKNDRKKKIKATKNEYIVK